MPLLSEKRNFFFGGHRPEFSGTLLGRFHPDTGDILSWLSGISVFRHNGLCCAHPLLEVTENRYFPVCRPINFTCVAGGSRTHTGFSWPNVVTDALDRAATTPLAWDGHMTCFTNATVATEGEGVSLQGAAFWSSSIFCVWKTLLFRCVTWSLLLDALGKLLLFLKTLWTGTRFIEESQVYVLCVKSSTPETFKNDVNFRLLNKQTPTSGWITSQFMAYILFPLSTPVSR